MVIAEGETGHVVTDQNNRVISMPESYRLALSSPPLAAAAPRQYSQTRSKKEAVSF